MKKYAIKRKQWTIKTLYNSFNYPMNLVNFGVCICFIASSRKIFKVKYQKLKSTELLETALSNGVSTPDIDAEIRGGKFQAIDAWMIYKEIMIS